jgi:hypothetical protein
MANLDFNSEFLIQFRMLVFSLKSDWKKNHDLNHDLLFYCGYNPLCMPEDKVSQCL